MTAVCSDTCPGLSPTRGAARDYERIAETLAPIHDRVVEAFGIGPGTRGARHRDRDRGRGAASGARRRGRRGIDIAADQLAKARRAAEAEGLNIRLDEGDCEALPYEDAEFDAVASAFGAIFAPDHARTAGEPPACAARRPARADGMAPRRVVAAWTGRRPDLPTGWGARPWARGARALAARRRVRARASARRLAHRSGLGRDPVGAASTSIPPLRSWLESRTAGARRARRRATSSSSRTGVLAAPTCSSSGRGDECDRSARRGHRPPPAPDPRRHDEPARQRDGGGRAPARLPRGERRRVRSSSRRFPSARTSSPASPAAAARRSSSSATPTSCYADPADWKVPPFSGELRDGEVWGRGALDMKSQVAANAVAIASLAREGFTPSGDLIFAATADEGRAAAARLRPAVALRGASRRGALRLRDQRGRRRAARARRRDAGLPGDRRGEDDRAVPPARARPRRSRVDAGHRRQRARQRGEARSSGSPPTGRSRRSGLRSRRSSARCSARCRRRTRPRRASRSSIPSPARSSRRSSRRPSPRRSSPPRRSATSSPRCARSRSTAASCPASIPSTSSR